MKSHCRNAALSSNIFLQLIQIILAGSELRAINSLSHVDSLYQEFLAFRALQHQQQQRQPVSLETAPLPWAASAPALTASEADAMNTSAPSSNEGGLNRTKRTHTFAENPEPV
jgi:hypothetical protein